MHPARLDRSAMMATESFQPLQLKGEIMDMEFTVDTDHRKRRRNRTTQSCLNCHTSKRKCDRKRPCQRCIQLGLTGLCVYEIDDPALRDDPSVDENTRLRNRIAELESLVRELRGKPHPRWADSSFRDGDPNEKWHSRAAKITPLAKRRGHSPERLGLGDRMPSRIPPPLMSPVKSEPSTDGSTLYRFTPSPPAARYNGYDQQHPSYNESYHTPSTSPSVQYTNGTNGAIPSSYSDSGSYNLSGSDDGNVYPSDQYNSHHISSNICSCRTNPATGIAYISLAQQLQSSLSSLRQYSHHPQNTSCTLYRRIVELNNAMQYVPVVRSPPANQANSCHLSGNEPAEAHAPPNNTFENAIPDREIPTPLSASSGHGSFHTGSSAGVAPQEWNALAAAGYNPYFPVHNDHNLYQQVMT